MNEQLIKYLKISLYILLFATLFVVIFPLDAEFSKLLGFYDVRKGTALLSDLTLNNLFFLFISSKGFVFRFLVEVAGMVYLTLFFLDKESRPKNNLVTWSLITLTAVSLLTAFLGENPIKSLWSNFERFEGAILIVHILTYFLMLSSVIRTEGVWVKFFKTSIGVSCFVSLYGLLQLIKNSDGSKLVSGHFGPDRVDATIGNPIYLAVYLLIHIFLIIYIWYTDSVKNKSFGLYFYPLLAIYETYILFTTGTRGAMGALAIGLLITFSLIGILEKKNRLLRNVSLGLVISIFVAVVALFAVRNTNFVQANPAMSRAVSVFNLGDALFSRSKIWSIAIKGFEEKPVFGWGQEGFSYVFNKYYDPKMYAQESWFDRAHNVYLDWMIAGGIFGIVSYLFILYAGFVIIWRKIKGWGLVEKSLFTGLLSAYMIHNFFVFDHLVSYMMFAIVLAYLVYKSEFVPMFWSKFTDKTEKTFSEWKYFIMAGSVIIFAFVYYNVIYKPYEVNTNLSEFLTNVSSNNIPGHGYPEALDNLKKAYSYNTGYLQEVAENSMIQGSKIIKGLSVTDKVKALDAEVTIRKIIDAEIKQSPNDPRLYLFYGSFLADIGQVKEAEKQLAKAVELSKNKQSILANYANILYFNGKTQEAYDALKKAYELEPSYRDMRIAYAGVALSLGKTEVFDLIKTDLANAPIDDMVVKGLLVSGKLSVLSDYLKEYLKENPNADQVRANLIYSYILAKNRWSALVELDKFIELRPAQKAYLEAKKQEVKDMKFE